MVVPIAAAGAPAQLARTPRDTLLLTAASVAVLLDLSSLVATGQALTTPLLTGSFLVSQVVLLLAAAVSIRTPGQGLNGRLMAALAGVYSVWDLLTQWPDVGPSAFLAGLVYWPVAAMYGHLLLRWPRTAVRGRPERWALAAGYGLLPLMTLVWQVVWDPAWFGGAAAHRWWITLVPNRPLAYTVWVVQQAAFLLLVVAFLTLVARRIVRTPPGDRRPLVPIAASSALLGAATITAVVLGIADVSSFDPALIQNLAVLTVPLAVLVASRRHRPVAIGTPVHAGVVRWHRLPLAWLAVAAGLVVLGTMIGVSVLASGDGRSPAHPEPAPAPALAPPPPG